MKYLLGCRWYARVESPGNVGPSNTSVGALQTTNFDNTQTYYQAGGVVPQADLDDDYSLYQQFTALLDSEKTAFNDAGSGDESVQVRTWKS